MRKSKRLYAVPLLVLMCYLVVPLSVSATTFDSGNAVQDILMDGRFAGAMSSIEWLTEMIDIWFIRVITVVAFFIISMSLLKNALAAAYCAFPVIFNRIHEAHEQMKWSEVTIGGISDLQNKIASGKISDVILSLIPDIKALTDFVEQEISPKAYFMKAIPQMCIMVIIGIFIYNGYYRDVSATVGEAGATLVENVLGSVSPEKAVNDIFNFKSDPKNTYASDSTISGKMIKTLSNSMYTTVKNYSNVYKESQENKEAVMRQAEYWAYQIVSNKISEDLKPTATGNSDENTDDKGKPQTSPFMGTEQYDLNLSNVKTQLVSSNQVTAAFVTTDTTDGSKAFRYNIPMSQWWNGQALAESEADLKNKTLVLTGNLTPVEKSGNTFETAVEAVEGNIESSTLGFSEVKLNNITATKEAIKAKDGSATFSNNQAVFRIDKFEAEIKEKINDNIAEHKPEKITRTIQSITYTNTLDAGHRVRISKGVDTHICNVKIVYIQKEDGASQSSTGVVELPLIFPAVNDI